MTTTSRKGLGLYLVLVLVLLLVLGTTGFARLTAASQTGSTAHRSIRGDVALLAAESAIDEMRTRVQNAVSDSKNPLFSKIRQEVYSNQTGQLDLPEAAKAPVLEALLGTSEMQGLKLARLSAEIIFQRQFENLPYERFGQIRYRARVVAPTFGGGAGVVRDLTVTQEFKTVLASIPRPFDQASIYLADAWSATDFSRVNRLRARYLQMVQEQVRLLDEAIALAPAELADSYSKIKQAIPSAAALEERVPTMPETRPLALHATGADGQNFPLDLLDLAGDLDRTESRTEGVRRDAVTALERLKKSPGDSSNHEAFLAALPKALEGTQAMLDRIWAFGEAFHFMGSDAPQAAAVTAELARLGTDHWRRIASYFLSDGQGRSAAADLQELRSRLKAPSGVIFIDAGKDPIVLEGSWPGRLVLAIRGSSVVLKNTNRDAAPGSLLTVVALGGQVTVQGQVEASLILAPEAGDSTAASLVMEPESELRGSLVATRLSLPPQAPGSVICRESIASGITTKESSALASLEHYVVTFAPAAAGRVLERQ